MIEDILPQIRKIFVGRESELRRLSGLWELACEENEHLVYVFLNAPGVGKTTLLHHFGQSIESEEKGLYLRIVCSNEFDDASRINKSYIDTIKRKLNSGLSIITNYINTKAVHLRARLTKELQVLLDQVDVLSNSSNPITLNDTRDVFIKLSNLIPIFLATDEIQEFQKLELEYSGEEPETALHFYTRLLKDLLNSRILIVLSGTRYHILSQIGENIGSPLRQKVDPLIVKNFSVEEVYTYVDELYRLIKGENLKLNESLLSLQINHYKRFLLAFSGGHPRSIEKISTQFLLQLHSLTNTSQYQTYDSFLNFFLPKMEAVFESLILPSAYKKSLEEMVVNEGFSFLKSWMLVNGSKGLFLGVRPRSTTSQLDEEIKRLLYDLINMGIIVQNGSNNYYLTSYFHFLEFLKLYHDPHEEFLKQVLFNKYFKLMCGSHSGFGYTFENVLAVSLLIKGQDASTLPIQISKLRSIAIIRGQINWTELDLEPNVLYQTPLSKAIDGIILQNEALFLLQITTAVRPDHSKITVLLDEIESLTSMRLKSNNIKTVRGWIISLYEFKSRPSHPEQFIITEGSALIPILGEELMSRLKRVKESFSD